MEIELDEFLNKKIKDEVFIIETDTVYGIGCLYNSLIGANKINEIKHRKEGKFYSILISNYDQLELLAKDFDDSISLMKDYWPGALTIIFKKTENVKDFVSKSDTVGIRMPDNKNTLKVLDKFGPMIMTSLNESGEEAITKYSDALKYKDIVSYIVKGKDLNSIPSTVYDSINKKVLRQGSIIINK